MPRQLICSIDCPICGAVANLHIAVGLPEEYRRPKVVKFDCPYAREHANPSHTQLLALPAELVYTVPDPPY
jgi:hypothetical protein